jgi:colanic acid biosynthesis glycosyl transferase WcaI
VRILLLNQCFYPDVVATAQMGWDLARSLRHRGHEVTAVSSRATYGTKGGRLPRRECVDGVFIRRIGLSLFGKSSLFARMIDFGLFHVLALIRVLTLPRQDVIVCFTTPPMVSLVGVILKVLRGTRVICWSMDLYPEVLAAGKLLRSNTFPYRLLLRFDTWLMQSCDRVVCLGRCMRQRMVDRGVDPERVEVVHVWGQDEVSAYEATSDTSLRSEWDLRNRFVVMYAGNLGLGHETATMERAIRESAHDPSIQWVFVGGGKGRESLQSRLLDASLQNVQFHPYQPVGRLPELLQTADVHMASMLPGWQGLIVPSKCIGVMAVGRPLIWIGPPDSECAREIEESGCGATVEPGNWRRLLDTVIAWKQDPAFAERMGKAGATAARGPLSRDRACTRWIQIIESLS